MIKIVKSANQPEILIRKGQEEREENKRLYDADPTSYQTGEKKFDIKNSIYGDKAVKEQLRRDQFEKCCFCEAAFTANGYGAVEHYRPKGGYLKKKSAKITFPGYYWKAYDWDNLFFSCEVCNTSYKGTYFPLADESQRAKNHHDNIANERPLLVHPSHDDPESFIGFREEVCFPKDDNEKGKESIAAYGLNREKLLENRREYLNNVGNNYFISSLDIDSMTPEKKVEILKTFKLSEEELIDLIEKARLFINRAARANSRFSSMVRHNYPDLPR